MQGGPGGAGVEREPTDDDGGQESGRDDIAHGSERFSGLQGEVLAGLAGAIAEQANENEHDQVRQQDRGEAFFEAEHGDDDAAGHGVGEDHREAEPDSGDRHEGFAVFRRYRAVLEFRLQLAAGVGLGCFHRRPFGIRRAWLGSRPVPMRRIAPA